MSSAIARCRATMRKQEISFRISSSEGQKLNSIHTKEVHAMKARFQEVRDPKTYRLLGVYCQEDGVFESRQKGRIMRIQFPPGTPIQFIFDDSEPAA